jgi:hypothetical protein
MLTGRVIFNAGEGRSFPGSASIAAKSNNVSDAFPASLFDSRKAKRDDNGSNAETREPSEKNACRWKSQKGRGELLQQPAGRARRMLDAKY